MKKMKFERRRRWCVNWLGFGVNLLFFKFNFVLILVYLVN